MRRLSFDKVHSWCQSHWGLTLMRNGGVGSVPYAIGGWTTGYTLQGHFPGRGMDWQRFATLREVAACVDYKADSEDH